MTEMVDLYTSGSDTVGKALELLGPGPKSFGSNVKLILTGFEMSILSRGS